MAGSDKVHCKKFNNTHFRTVYCKKLLKSTYLLISAINIIISKNLSYKAYSIKKNVC